MIELVTPAEFLPTPAMCPVRERIFTNDAWKFSAITHKRQFQMLLKPHIQICFGVSNRLPVESFQTKFPRI